jgi:UDP-glucose 4-epimerase
MKMVVTGAAGFIGSSLVDRLLTDGHEVIGVDNFSTGQRKFLESALRNPKFKLVKLDLLKESALDPVLSADTTWVFHLAANADVRDGLKHPRKDLEQNTLVSWNVLEAMRRAGAKRIAFSSTGSVYGEAPVIPTPETCPFPIQTSLYGASKLSGEALGEALISSYAEGYGIRGLIFRFVSILGERYTHGHVFDFIRHLEKDSTKLPVLGNGKQKKSYLYIGDCLEAILTATRKETGRPVDIYNLGTDEYVQVDDSIKEICEEMKLKPRLEYSGGERGWVGDNPFIFLDCSKIRALGWRPQKSIRESVRLTVRYLVANRWIFEARQKEPVS